MTLVQRFAGLAVSLAVLATPLAAQDGYRAQTLADIRQELTVLHVDIQRLKGELNTTGAAAGIGAGGSTLDRVNALEAQITRLTGKTEELEHRINQVVRDGTTRIANLEFRLVELEGGDVSKLGETTTLGGGALPDDVAARPRARPTPEGSQLAVAERADFDAAVAALEGGDPARAAQLFAAFAQSYPGSPLAGQANFMRGEALSEQGKVAEAARGYLDSFSGAPHGPYAASALFKLGVALGNLGQASEACVTLGQVGVRFPNDAAAADARAAMTQFGCN